MKRLFLGCLAALGLLVVAAGIAFFVLRGPDPETILAGIERPASPELEPEEARAAFRVAAGFRVELVAAEPLVVDPVAMDWDDEGRLYVVEMRGYMPDLEGRGEARANGQVVLLEDVDGDGTMDTRRVFLDGLVLPRAVRVLPEGVLIAEPERLWLCRDTTGDGRCDERRLLGRYALPGPSPEHQENGLLPGPDGWIYNAKSERRIRLEGDGFVSAPSPFRGQWGIAQDDEGHLFYNHNSGFLYGEVFPGEYAMRQAFTAARLEKPGLNVPLADGEQVWGVRVAPGLNRAYVRGTLRADGRQDAPTGVSGLEIQRGHQYGPDFMGDAFVPESAGNTVSRFRVTRDGTTLAAEHVLEPDPEWGEREFLASTDERFRPVDAQVGPDGAIHVIDMYRGVIQHAVYVSDYLADYVEKNDLAPPGARGRIWRLVREDRPIERRPPPLDGLAAQVAALDHPNGWVRDHAQRRLVHEADSRAADAIRAFAFETPLGRVHALWTLAGLEGLDDATWRSALADPDPRVRRAALRASESRLDALAEGLARVEARLEDPDARVRLQAIHTLGGRPLAPVTRDRLLDLARRGEPLVRQAVLSGLAGQEPRALSIELAAASAGPESGTQAAWLGELAAAVHRAAQQAKDPASAVAALFDQIAASAPDSAVAMLDGIVVAQRAPGAARVVLASAHPIFSDMAGGEGELAAALARVRPHVTWAGDPRPGGARPLDAAEEALRARGETLFANSCATCHGTTGAGQSGLAPSLVGSPWVRDADDWLLRIMLHGVTGPIVVDGETWENTMPGHAMDPRFDDEGVAAVATFLRRAWGHGDEPVSPDRVAAIRALERDRALPWTVAELEALPVAHRLDDYVGRYDIPLPGIHFVVERRGPGLVIGRGDGAVAPLLELGLDTFTGEGLMLLFERDEAGLVDRAAASFQGTSFTLGRID
ncbi:MAG: c-type cytochrome [Myxococcota bacterium]